VAAYVFDKQELMMKFVKIAVLLAAVASLGACAATHAGSGNSAEQQVFDPMMRK
jgi:hypothetical protein